jgi:hypothetical protein
MVVDHSGLAELLAFWTSHYDREDLPRRSAFTAEALKPWLGNIGILDVERSPLRFRIRLAGTHIVRYFGRDCSGLYLDEVVPATDCDGVLGLYFRCIACRTPQFDATYSHVKGIAGYLVRRLALPVTLAGGDVEQIIVGFYAEAVNPAAKDWRPDRRDIARTILQRA